MHSRILRLLPAALVLAACSDRTPVDPGQGPPPASLAALHCTADVRGGTVSCAPAAPGTGGGARFDLVVGGQNDYVRLTSSGVSYDGSAVFRADVTLRNLMPQAIGTTDGVTPAAQGIRVFFHSGPVVTEGTGTVEVANEDGADVFTAEGQPFFRYAEVLYPEQTSAPREWRFSVPSTVDRFDFVVLVSAPVADEDGWVNVSPPRPSLPAGSTVQLAATVRSPGGKALAGAAVAWSSSDTSVARVDAAGLVTGVAPGTAVITAASEGRTGSTEVTVTAAGGGDATPPTLTGFALASDTVDVSAGPDTVYALFQATDALAGVTLLSVTIQSPGGGTRVAPGTCTQTSGTPQDGSWSCEVRVPRNAEAGAWRVIRVLVQDQLGNARYYETADLQTAGFEWVLWVVSQTPDTTAPELTAFSFAPDSIDVVGSADTVVVTFSAGDDLTGVGYRSVSFRSAGDGPIVASGTCERTAGTDADLAGTYECPVHFPRFSEGGSWSVFQVVLEDSLMNRRAYDAAALQAAGFPTALHVTSAAPDTGAPVLTGLSFAPDTVHVAAGADTVDLTLSATDDISGVARLSATFESPSGATRVAPGSCTRISGTDNAGSWTCAVQFLQFAEHGTWTLIRVTLDDAVRNMRQYFTPELQSAGYPITVTVVD